MINVESRAIVSLEATLVKIAYGGLKTYNWAIDRKANNHDDIQGNIMYIGITCETSRPTPAYIYYYYSTHLQHASRVLSS